MCRTIFGMKHFPMQKEKGKKIYSPNLRTNYIGCGFNNCWWSGMLPKTLQCTSIQALHRFGVISHSKLDIHNFNGGVGEILGNQCWHWRTVQLSQERNNGKRGFGVVSGILFWKRFVLNFCYCLLDPPLQARNFGSSSSSNQCDWYSETLI